MKPLPSKLAHWTARVLAFVAITSWLTINSVAPASAATTDPIAFEFSSECGKVSITVTNNTNAEISYTLVMTNDRRDDPMGPPLEFRVPAGEANTHDWLVDGGHGVIATSPALTDPVTYQYPGFDNCTPNRPALTWSFDCHGNALVHVENWSLTSPLTGLALARDEQVGDFFTLDPFTRHEEIIAGLAPGDTFRLIWSMGSGVAEAPTWMNATYRINPKCSYTPEVKITQTCSGLRIETTNTEKSSTLRASWTTTDSLRVFHHEDFTVDQNEVLQVDVDLPKDQMIVRIGWVQLWDTSGGAGVAAGFAAYDRAAACSKESAATPTSAAPTTSLPVTGGNLPLTAGVGLIFLVAGTVVVALARSRRVN